ncbi:MAG: MFS transporter, partial [Deltaproteobacteria bacterium]|nr:MFS transporter [Deltaproteobacteria bacterium]
MSQPHRSSGILVLYGSAALWCTSIGMSHVLIPLYAIYLGFSILQIASIVSLPVVATLGIRFMGGALSDRFGERLVLHACYLLNTLAAVVLYQAEGFVSLLIAQIISNKSRSFFWTPAQSIASQLPGASSSKRLGQLSACNAAGNLAGLSLGGVVAATAGYPGAFVILFLATLASSVLGFFLPHVEAKPKGRSVWKIFVGIGKFLCHRPTWLTISASFAAGLAPALTQSIYPIYLAQLGYGEQWIGFTVALRALGPIASGLMLAPLITPSRQAVMYAAGIAGLGVFVIGSGSLDHIIFLGFCMAALGTSSGLMDVLYQVRATQLSSASDRSAAMASMGLGWNLAYIVTPVVVGWLAELYGIKLALMITGTFLIFVSSGTRLWYRLLGAAVTIPLERP